MIGLLAAVSITLIGLTDLATIEGQVLAHKKALVSGVIVVHSQNFGGKNRHPFRSVNTTIYWDGKSARADISENNSREIRSFSDFDKKLIFHKRTLEQKIEDSINISIADYSTLPSKKEQVGYAVVDPRLIGVVPFLFENLVYEDLNSVIGRPDRENTSVVEESIDGAQCYRISYNLISNKTITTYWVDPSKDFNVIRCQNRIAPGTKSEIVNEVNTDFQFVDEAKKWFPKSCRFTQLNKGAPTFDEELEITVKELNKPLGKDAFTSLKTMDIPSGTGVSIVPDNAGSSLYWDGKSIMPRHPRLVQVATAEANRSWRKWFMVSSFLGFTILALIAVRRGVRQSTH